MEFTYPDGATPLDPNEIEGLIPNIRFQSELNTREETNIVAARRWAFSPRNHRLRKNLLSIDGLQLVHRRMFYDVWQWAGTFRLTEKSIGVDPFHIAADLHNLCEDVKAQLEFRSMPLDESAIRFHHRLVQIHPFPNGNGRHARLVCDLFLQLHGGTEFTWGQGNPTNTGELKKNYIDALRRADRGDIIPLLEFAKS
jgi:Fic-DOC domain mobile mystery protein B